MSELLRNTALVYGFVSWFVAQVIKIALQWKHERRFDLRTVFAAGGMPSSHSALVCSIAVAVAMSEGIGSPLFAVAVGVAAVVMYDAAGVRRAAGHHATILNQIIDELFQGHPISDEKLGELLGHTPTQVLLGALLGIVLTWVGMAFVWDGA